MKTETKNRTTEIPALLEELDSLNDENIRAFCREHGLDYNCSRDYSYAAMMECEYMRPLTRREASLILKAKNEELPLRNSRHCKTTGIMHNGNCGTFESESLYGFWKDLERAVKEQKKSVQRRARHLIRNTDAWNDDGGNIHLEVGTTLDRAKIEKDKGIDRLKKELELGAIRTLADNLRRISKEYDRCVDNARASSRTKQEFHSKRQRCNDKAAHQTRVLMRPVQQFSSPGIKQLVKDITVKRRFENMKEKLKDYRDDYAEELGSNIRFFDWL